jgi:hypothetical protein
MINLPADYIKYVENGDAMYGDTDLDFGGYFELEPLDSVVKMNSDVQIEKYAPGYIAFGCDGGGELFVFDLSGKVYLMPMIGMEPSAAVKLADSWTEYTSHLQINAQQGSVPGSLTRPDDF